LLGFFVILLDDSGFKGFFISACFTGDLLSLKVVLLLPRFSSNLLSQVGPAADLLCDDNRGDFVSVSNIAGWVRLTAF